MTLQHTRTSVSLVVGFYRDPSLIPIVADRLVRASIPQLCVDMMHPERPCWERTISELTWMRMPFFCRTRMIDGGERRIGSFPLNAHAPPF